MATTTASKSGLRAAATARTTKAAQRTPLPPKAGVIALAKEAVEEVKAAKAPRAPRKTAAQREAALLAEITEAVENGADFEEVAAPAPKRTRKAPATAKAAPAPVAVVDDKAQGYIAPFEALGWTVEVHRTDGLQEFLARRGDEALFLSWRGKAHISGGSTYTFADRTIKVRNPAEALRMAGRAPEEAKTSQAKVSGNRQFRRRPTGPSVGKLPFDVETVDEATLAAALTGRTVRWHNHYRVEPEVATVGRIAFITLVTHRLGHRIVSFIDPSFGFRAFRLDNLESVGGRSKKLAA